MTRPTLPPFHPGGFLVGLVVGHVIIAPIVAIGVTLLLNRWWP